jgi:signal transduction histidine kinase
MKHATPCCRILAVFAALAGSLPAAEAAWDVRLAGAFSGRLREIGREQAELEPVLKLLPGIPIDDQGGTGGFAGIHPRATPEGDTRHAMEIRWRESAKVDLVALVPARRYDAKGLDAQYGLPDAFTVELLDPEGGVVACLARERHVRSQPVRMGHPFVYQVFPPVEAAGLRISADRLLADPEEDGGFIHAWAEAFVFQGKRNVAWGAEVRSLGGAAPRAPWHWSPAFLVDGQTPLGLPEIPGEEHANIGWLSKGRDSATEPTALTVDLGEIRAMDGIRLIPAKRPTSDLPSGFGFPRRMAISISDTNDPADAGKWTLVSETGLRNPGHNPVFVPFREARGRFVRVEATELWKDFENYPAFFALSEVELLDGGENLALGKPVRSSDGMLNLVAPGGRYWSGAALSDGFGPDGRLVPAREWLIRLNERLRFETRRHELQIETGRVIGHWRNAGLSVFAFLGLAGAFAAIAMPIRYRIQANRDLIKVRERIAGDLHDEVGSNLGSIQMFADLAEGRSGPSEELKRIQRIAAETVSAVRDIVWLLRPQGDHRIATVEHLRETASIMLENLKWKFTANETAWGVELPEEANRDLFLFFREALHNIARHAKATEVEVRVESTEREFQLRISDNGVGIETARLERPATLRALRQRSVALAADLRVDSKPGEGTRLILTVPLDRKRMRKLRRSLPEKNGGD